MNHKTIERTLQLSYLCTLHESILTIAKTETFFEDKSGQHLEQVYSHKEKLLLGFHILELIIPAFVSTQQRVQCPKKRPQANLSQFIPWPVHLEFCYLPAGSKEVFTIK